LKLINKNAWLLPTPIEKSSFFSITAFDESSQGIVIEIYRSVSLNVKLCDISGQRLERESIPMTSDLLKE